MSDTRPLIPHDGGTPDIALADARDIIEHAIVNQPRSLQTTIGPSELGTPCDHCLAAKLAGWSKDEEVPWLPFIGTAVHAHLSAMFVMHELFAGERRWLSEERVAIGTIGGQQITGTCDLFDVATGTVIDFKIVGKTTLDSARRNGPSPVYETQVNLYALGYANAGHPVNHVAIAYLPRNAITLSAAVWWHAPHNPDIAHAAIERANRIHTNLTAMATISPEFRDQWISDLPRHPDCRDCSRYPDKPETLSPLRKLLA